MESETNQGYAIQECPTVYPTAKEFQNFQEYINKLEREYSDNSGIVKIVPPKKWKARTADYDQAINTIKIPGPIEQNTYGKGGFYELLLIQKKSVTLGEFRKKAEYFNNITDGKSVEEVEDTGADFMDTLFDSNTPWNLTEIQTFLKQIKKNQKFRDGLSQIISGVTFPYLYVGAWKSIWHKEDLDLNAINYNHYGKPKFWYSIPYDESYKLEQSAKQHFADSFSKCQEYLRHKTVMISPYVLQQKHKGNIKISKACQRPGEFILTMSGAYHCGFNWGFNIGISKSNIYLKAEAVNLASLGWLKKFYDAQVCQCSKDNVKIDKLYFLDFLAKSKFKNEPEFLFFKNKIQEGEKQIQINKVKQTKSARDKLQYQLSYDTAGSSVKRSQSVSHNQNDTLDEDQYRLNIKKQKPTSSSALPPKKLIKKSTLNSRISARRIKKPYKYSL